MTEKQVSPKGLLAKYVIAGILFAMCIGLFSLIMAGIADYRNSISYENYYNTSTVYNGPLEQSAPSLRSLEATDEFYQDKGLTPALVKKYIDNTFLTSTDAKVIITADFVKKGLELQPTYKTDFTAEYVLKNSLKEKSVISFVFPLPVNGETNEISNARLVINGEEINDAKTKVTISDTYGYTTSTDALRWDGEIGPESEIVVAVSYNTVGLSLFTYKGIENSKGSQDFNFLVRINGTRAYNVIEGLSVDERTFGEDYVELIWNKSDLFSKPLIKVSVGDKLNPSTQVSRIYLTMSPIYVVFIAVVLYLAYKFGRALGLFDMFLVTVLFVVFFPFVHYLSSFTVDPTIELFSGIAKVGEFSMPLYSAFAIAWVVVGGLMFYLIGRISGFKMATKYVIPTLILFLGFFPLVVTIPEYSMLLVIIGFIALMAIIVQVRINMASKKS